MAKYLFWVCMLMTTPALADIDVALVGPMTGGEAAFGEQMKHGAEIAVDDLNARGGLDGQKIHLVVEDDACDPQQALNVANHIAAQGIKYVIGHWCSGATQVASPVYAEEGILELDPAGLLPETTQKGVFTMLRLSSTADYWGKVLADYSVKGDHPKKAYVLIDRRAVTEVFGDTILSELKKADPSIDVASDKYDGGQKDFFTLISKMKQFGADTVFISGYTQEIALIVRQAEGTGMKFRSWDVMGSPDFEKTVGKDGIAHSIYVDYARPAASADLARFNKTLDDRSWPRETYTYMAYAALQVLDQAWKQAPSGQPNDLATALHANSYDTIMGPMKFAQNGDNQLVRFSAYKWDGAKQVEIAPAN